jgi:hypothetical protein
MNSWFFQGKRRIFQEEWYVFKGKEIIGWPYGLSSGGAGFCGERKGKQKFKRG